MFAYQDRLVFAQSVLNGEEDAHHILADLLEEEGDRSLAHWARAPKKNRNKRLDFVLAVLPHMLTLRTSTCFLLHSLTLLSKQERRSYIYETNNENMSQLIRAVQAIRDWTLGKVTEQILSDSCTRISAVGPWGYGIKDIDQTMQTLHLAATNASLAESNTNNRKTFLKHSSDSRNASRKVTKAAREMLRPLQTMQMLRENPLAWQFDFLMSVVSELIEEASA